MHSQSLMFEMGLLRQCRERVARHRWWASFHCLTEAMGKEFNYSSVHFGEKSHWHWTSDKRQTDSDGLSAYVWQENYRWPVAIKCRCAFMYRHASSTLLIVEAFCIKNAEIILMCGIRALSLTNGLICYGMFVCRRYIPKDVFSLESVPTVFRVVLQCLDIISLKLHNESYKTENLNRFCCRTLFYFGYQTANQHFTRIDFCTNIKKNVMHFITLLY